MEFSNKAVIEKFDPTEAQLREIVSETNALSVSDLKDKAQLKVVRETRIKLKNARVSIQKQGKELRDDANKFSKAVIEREKELIAIIEPEERRLELIEEEAEKLAILEDRRTNLPSRIARLETIGDGLENNEEYILTLDSNQFDAYFNQRFAAKVQKDKEESERAAAEADRARREEQERKDAEIAERERAAAEQEDENRREAERLEANKKLIEERAMNLRIQSLLELGLKFNGEGYVKDDIFFPILDLKTDTDEQWSERVGKVRIEIERRNEAAKEAEREREEKVRQEEREKAERAAKEKEEREEAQRKAEEKAEAEAKVKRERAKKYKAFRAELGWTEETQDDFYELVIGKEGDEDYRVVFFKKVGEFNLKK